MARRADSDEDSFLEVWHRDGSIEVWPAEEPSLSLDEEAIRHPRLKGGASADEVAKLLRQIDIQEGAELWARLTKKEWAEKSALDERYWAIPGSPLIVRLYRSRKRPDVVARFVALVKGRAARAPAGSTAFWIASGYLAWTESGELVVEQLTLEPEHGGQGGLTPDVLRDMSLSQIVARAQGLMQLAPEYASLARKLGLLQEAEPTDADAEAEALAAAAAGPRPRGGRSGYSDDLYRWVAEEYLRLHDAGVGRGILIKLAALASERMLQNVSRSKMRDWVRRARELGFLEGGERGRAGARPGPRIARKRPQAVGSSGRQRKEQNDV